MDKLKVYPLMLPTHDESPLYMAGLIPKVYIGRVGSGTTSGNQHLYLISDREIKKDWKGVAYKSDVVGKVFKHFYTTNIWYNDAKIVEATTDPSLGLPLIPKSFIQEWVEKHGKIEYVYISFSFNDSSDFNSNPQRLLPSIREVMILPVKNSWNSEEIKTIYKSFRQDNKESAVIGGPPYWTFDEWFDKNY